MNISSSPYLTILRDQASSMDAFRKAADAVSHLLAQQVIASSKTIKKTIHKSEGKAFSQRTVLVPILRSGLAMLGPFQHYFEGPVGFLGIVRDEATSKPELYYQKIPKAQANDRAVLLDPMLATAGTGLQAVSILKTLGYLEKNITFAAFLCAKAGRERLATHHPNLTTVIAAEDPELNEKNFIFPGFGDFGDRYFGAA